MKKLHFLLLLLPVQAVCNTYVYDFVQNSCLDAAGNAGKNGAEFYECGEISPLNSIKELNLISTRLLGAKFTEGSFSNTSFRGSFLTGATFYDVKLSKVDFSRADLQKAKFSDNTMSDVNFTSAYFKDTLIKPTTLEKSTFEYSKIKSTQLSPVNLEHNSFRFTTFEYGRLGSDQDNAIIKDNKFYKSSCTTPKQCEISAKFQNNEFNEMNFGSFRLTNGKFEGDKILNSSFQSEGYDEPLEFDRTTISYSVFAGGFVRSLNGSRLKNVQFIQTIFDSDAFVNAQLENPTFVEVEFERTLAHKIGGMTRAYYQLCTFKRIDFSKEGATKFLEGANLFFAEFNKSKFIKSNLKNINFRVAKFIDVSFFDSSMQNVEFGAANLAEMDFRKNTFDNVNFNASKLQEADFSGSEFLYGTFFRSAFLNGANFTGAIFTKGTLTFKDSDISAADFTNTTGWGKLTFTDALSDGSTKFPRQWLKQAKEGETLKDVARRVYGISFY